jgi:D-psicose/D-tagatose/L-ribulose 3-epimerase
MSGSKSVLTFGICSGAPGEPLAKALRAGGSDYYEPGMWESVMVPSQEEFDTQLSTWSEGGLEPRTANLFLPGDLKVVGPDVDGDRVQAYMAEALRRARALGIGCVVFGSAGAREVPEGFPRDEAYRQLKEAVRWASEAAHKADENITICLEHLNKGECNIVNSLAEAGEIVHELDLANVALVVDIFHLMEEREDFGVVRDVADKLAHVHVSGPDRHPPSQVDEDRLASLFEQLAGIGYTGRVSIESDFSDILTEAPGALGVVRRSAELAGLGS